MSAESKMTELKTGMLLYVPFFASLLFDQMKMQVGKFPHIFGGMTPTGATDGMNIWLDEDFLDKLKLPEAVFLVCHEIGHSMWAHMARAKNYMDAGFDGEPFDPRLWNIAGDYVINDMLKKSGIGDMPKGGLWRADITHDMLAEDAYRMLRKEQKDKGGGGGKGDGLGGNGAPDSNGNDGSTLDVHIQATPQATEAEWRRAVQSAVDAAKAIGNLPGALERFADQFVNAQVPWQEKLRFTITHQAARDAVTWRSAHKRRLALQGLIYPKYTGFGAGQIIVAVDTSGSIGERELNTFFSELAAILDDCKPEQVFVLGIDAEVNSIEELDPGANLAEHPPKVLGGGGTDFRPAFKWVENEGHEPACLIYFTDMYGPFPEEEPGYPVIWCSTTKDKEGPIGETVYVEIK